MIIGMRMYSSLHSVFSIQSAGFVLLFMEKLPFLHTELKHSVFVYPNKIDNYIQILEVVANISVDTLPKSI